MDGLQKRYVGAFSNPGEANVCCTSRNEVTVQADDEMLDVLPLQAENDGVVLGGDDGRFLPVDDAGGLVAIFGEQDLHVLERVDRAALGHGCAWYCGQRTLICEEMHHNNVIDALHTSSRHGHDGGGIFGHEGPPDVVVGQVTLGTEDHVLLDAVQLLLGRLGVAHEVQEPGVVLVHYAKLLIKEVFDGVPGMEGVSVVDDGGGRRHPASFGLERLLLMLNKSNQSQILKVYRSSLSGVLLTSQIWSAKLYPLGDRLSLALLLYFLVANITIKQILLCRWRWLEVR